MTNEPVIHTEKLGKSYGRVEAVRELNLSIKSDRITAFLGLNGAGKSSTIKMLLGITPPSIGDGTILGRRISDPIESIHIRTKFASQAHFIRTGVRTRSRSFCANSGYPATARLSRFPKECERSLDY
jgi:ABC-type multidrug transport system ATPase subunit